MGFKTYTVHLNPQCMDLMAFGSIVTVYPVNVELSLDHFDKTISVAGI